MCESPARGIRRRTEIELTASLVRRFWRYVHRMGPDDCWPWRGADRGNGYGVLKAAGGYLSAHRISYVIHHGAIPAGLIICHRCDTRYCCNPQHLYAGSYRDNVHDMIARGHWNHATGEKMSHAVLTPAKVGRIWRLRKRGLGRWRIAADLEVSRQAIRRVLEGKTWKHLRPSWAE